MLELTTHSKIRAIDYGFTVSAVGWQMSGNEQVTKVTEWALVLKGQECARYPNADAAWADACEYLDRIHKTGKWSAPA